MAHSFKDNGMALQYVVTALVMSLRDSGALHPVNFLENASAARDRLATLGYKGVVDAMDDMMTPIADGLGFKTGLDQPPPTTGRKPGSR